MQILSDLLLTVTCAFCAAAQAVEAGKPRAVTDEEYAEMDAGVHGDTMVCSHAALAAHILTDHNRVLDSYKNQVDTVMCSSAARRPTSSHNGNVEVDLLEFRVHF